MGVRVPQGMPFLENIMAITHVLIPFTTEVACGSPGHEANAAYREMVTCRQCRASPLFRDLPNLPTRFRKTKREKRN